MLPVSPGRNIGFPKVGDVTKSRTCNREDYGKQWNYRQLKYFGNVWRDGAKTDTPPLRPLGSMAAKNNFTFVAFMAISI
jgi:hypothetical protein